MEKHYQIVDGNIVFNVEDDEIVLRELEEYLNGAFENPDGEESLKFTVELYEQLADPEDANNIESYTTLSVSDSESGTIINYTAKAPVLVNVDGKFCHYWDFVLTDYTMTDLFDDEDNEIVDHLEDLVIKAIEATAKH